MQGAWILMANPPPSSPPQNGPWGVSSSAHAGPIPPPVLLSQPHTTHHRNLSIRQSMTLYRKFTGLASRPGRPSRLTTSPACIATSGLYAGSNKHGTWLSPSEKLLEISAVPSEPPLHASPKPPLRLSMAHEPLWLGRWPLPIVVGLGKGPYSSPWPGCRVSPGNATEYGEHCLLIGSETSNTHPRPFAGRTARGHTVTLLWAMPLDILGSCKETCSRANFPWAT